MNQRAGARGATVARAKFPRARWLPYLKNGAAPSDSWRKGWHAGPASAYRCSGPCKERARMKPMTRQPIAVPFQEEDLPQGLQLQDGPIAVDTEAMGLMPGRDRLCLVQLSDGRGDEHLVRFSPGSDYSAPNLKALLADPDRLKIYHFARFDIALIRAYLNVMAAPVYCTRTASRLVRTYTDRHGLKELVKEILAQDLSKQQQTRDWGASESTDAQPEYLS